MITAEELYSSPQRERHELVRGALLLHEPPGGSHGRIAVRIAHLLHTHVERYRLGTVLVESGYVLRRGPDTVRGPDVSFVSAARLLPERIPDQFIDIAPDLAVEVLSPEDRARDVEDRVADYLTAGTRCVWLVDPRRREIIVRRAAGADAILRVDDELDGSDAVPGFRCGVAEVFGGPTTSRGDV